MEKRNKVIILISSIALLVALICVVLGFGIANGWQSVLNWFGSPWAIWVYVLVGGWALFLAFLLIGDKIRRM